MFNSQFAASPPNMPPSPDNLVSRLERIEDGTISFGDGSNPIFDPDDYLNAEFMASPTPNDAQLNFGSPAIFQTKQNPMPHFQPRSAQSSTSPESSTQDSSSDSSGRRKRKSPSTSSPGIIFESLPFQQGDARNSHGLEIQSGKQRAKVDSPVFKQEDSSVGILNNSITQKFTLQSAANSPPAMGSTPHSQPWIMGTPRSLADHDYNLMPVQTTSPAAFQLGAISRDNTPPSAVSFESAHNTPFMLMRDSPDTDRMSFPGQAPFGGMADNFTMFSPPPPSQTTTNMGTIRPVDIGRSPINYHVPPIKFHVSHIGNKSRVETQIPVKVTLDPLPPHIKRLHLPTETIAKAKFLAKEIPPSPDTLELSAMLVCTSAMEKAENREHACQIAREGSHLRRGTNPRRSSTGDSKKGAEVDPSDPDSPVNGGPVLICDNCVSRERKRAGRKKAKKQEDEERWHEFERDRIIMFNTQEYLDFHPPTATKDAMYAENVTFSPEAMQIDAPMRIVCYCRHQQEKIGFQVIFTVKDWQGHVIAQQFTESILITDDHKTHAHGASQSVMEVAETPQFATPSYSNAVQAHGLPGRAYHSSINLASMGGQNWNGVTQTIPTGQRSSTVMTPRNLSRPASPSGHAGPKKKRKGSGSQHKIPPDLMMTRTDMVPLSAPAVTATRSQAMTSLVSPDGSSFGRDTNLTFGQNPQSFQTPPTPDASVKVGDANNNYFYSAPNSAHASRAASPTSFVRQNMAIFNTQPGASATQYNSMQFNATDVQQPSASIYKVRPEHGPTSGNIEVVILGKNFSRNLEVMFGDNMATTTTFWSSDVLVCLLPPTTVAGPVAVTMTSTGRQYSPPTMSAPMFTYVDDTKQQLFELAIQLQCATQLGPGADHFQYAQSILHGQNQGSGGPFAGGQAGGFNRNVLGSASTEDLILTIINKVDNIDSPYTPQYDCKREGGATLLSLACSLGYGGLVAGLLARGADPDVVDAGGFTPLMLAALHGRSAIVRRLILRGADPSMRNLRGMSAAELASSSEVRHFVRHRRHYRSASVGTPYMRSRANSAASTRSLWGPPSSSASSTMYSTDDESAVDSSVEDDEGEVEDVSPMSRSALASRRPSVILLHSRRGSELVPALVQSAPPLPTASAANGETAIATTIATFSAMRDQLTAQINALQQNLPSMQMPDLLQEQHFQALGRRFSFLVPTRREVPSARPDSPCADPPPSYHEACPDGVDNDFDTKPPEILAPIVEASSTAAIDLRGVTASGSKVATASNTRQRIPTGKVTIGKTSPTAEEAAELRRMRQEKLTPAKHDTNLWILWTPLLTTLVVWWVFGLRIPTVASGWIDSARQSLVKVIPALPERLRLAPTG